jgi:glycoprotein endo-alpha-1,2-mannosidase
MKMKRIAKYTIIVMLILAMPAAIISLGSCSEDIVEPDTGEPVKVSKTNPMTIYMHYMPWFQSKEVSGYWGSHWRMNTANPDIMDGEGRRQIASHYYPLIGPYDSKDPDVIEYHLLLMKYSGVDGILMDWYSSFNVNDYRALLEASNAVTEISEETGLALALVYEDYTAEAVEDQTSTSAIDAAKADLMYMQQHYFNASNYIDIDGKPLLLTFGPRFFKTGEQWTTIFSSLQDKPKFVPLWNHGALVGNTDNGEFSWIDFKSDLSDLHTFYGRTTLEILIGSAFAGFHDYYVEGGWGTSYGHVDYNNGESLRNTLAKAEERGVDRLQLVTWNDFGEGTMLEPTAEYQFEPLTIIQEFTGVSYGLDELQLIHSYYLEKKKYRDDQTAREKLEKAYRHLNDLEVSEARQIIDELK